MMNGVGEGTAVDRPNVVVVVADTFRRDHMGAYGNPWIQTPAPGRVRAFFGGL